MGVLNTSVKDGVAHLRIENRVLPSGPSVLDEVANAAFFFGLMSALGDEYGEIAHWEPFIEAYRAWITATFDPPYTRGEAARRHPTRDEKTPGGILEPCSRLVERMTQSAGAPGTKTRFRLERR